MWARVTRFSLDPSRIADVRQYVAETAIPAVKSRPGFTSGYWMIDESNARTLNVTVWESEAAMRATEPHASQLREGAQEAGATLESVEGFEVIPGSGPPESGRSPRR
jgi:quinol monooxygenase YgiN